MAQLNFPDPNDTQEFEAAGILWTWNDTLKVWSSETTTAFDAGDLYLSKRNDDAADGNIDFRGLTTHQQGVQLPNLTNAGALATDVDGNIIAGTDSGSGDEFLSSVDDDTAQGVITFKQRSRHEQGINFDTAGDARLITTSNTFSFATGTIDGGGFQPLTIARNHESAKAVSVSNLSPQDGSNKAYYGGLSTRVGIEGITASGGNSNSNNIPCVYTSSLYFDAGSSCTTFSHYNVGASRNLSEDGTGKAPDSLYGYLCSSAAFGMNDGTTNTAFGSTTICAFNTNLNSNTAGAKEVFAINCTGDAQSYFAGPVTIVANTTARKYIADSTYRTTGGGSYGYTCSITHILDGGTNSNNIYPTSFKSAPKVQTKDVSNLSHFLAQSTGFEGNGSIINQRVFDCSVNVTDTAATTYGFIARLNTGSKTNWNFYATGTAASRITNLQTTYASFLTTSELDQVDDEGNPIPWEQPTAATVGTGIYRNEAGALCFARNGECALEIGDGQVIGNLLDKLQNMEAQLATLQGALERIEVLEQKHAAMQGTSTTDSGPSSAY